MIDLLDLERSFDQSISLISAVSVFSHNNTIIGSIRTQASKVVKVTLNLESNAN